MEAREESQLTVTQRGAKRPGQARAALAAALPLAVGLALRLWMLKHVFQVNGDMLVYGDLAKNLLHGSYSLSMPGGGTYPTLIRLPGYPLFLAACFRLFGMENYFAVACVQIALDLLGCLLVAAFVRRITPGAASRGAALATLWLASLCPFTAAYDTASLTETATLFMLALAMWAMARFRQYPGWANALWFTFAVTCATLLRPDGALAAVAFTPALLMGLGRNPSSDSTLWRRAITRRKLMRMAVVCVVLALAPFAVWTARNWRVFHVFQPLAPRLANNPDERPNLGLEHWVRSWCLDFASTYQIYWRVPGDELDVSKLPRRAFDTPAQYAETVALAAGYNRAKEITPDIDAQFQKLADERIAADPLRYYLWLPLGRVADMWLRPRVENLNIDPEWWVDAHHKRGTEFSWAYVALNALYLLLGIAGLCMKPRFWGAMLAYMLLRSALLATISAPEARYTLECFPMLFAAGGIALGRFLCRRSSDQIQAKP